MIARDMAQTAWRCARRSGAALNKSTPLQGTAFTWNPPPNRMKSTDFSGDSPLVTASLSVSLVCSRMGTASADVSPHGVASRTTKGSEICRLHRAQTA